VSTASDFFNYIDAHPSGGAKHQYGGF